MGIDPALIRIKVKRKMSFMEGMTIKTEDLKNSERIEIEGKVICLPNPEEIPGDKFIGRREILIRALAAWSRIDGKYPLNFRLYGPPGVGKNAIVYELARKLKKDCSK